MKYTQVPSDLFKKIQINAGIIASAFEPETGAITATNILMATSGGSSFSAEPSFTDFGEDIDNIPKNTMELKKLDSVEVKLSGTAVTMDTAQAKSFMAAADVVGNKVTPRADLKVEDFKDLWWIGDYSDENSGDSAGFIAIRTMNALSTGGFKIKSEDKTKGNFDFEYTGHYSTKNPEILPYEVYIRTGGAE